MKIAILGYGNIGRAAEQAVLTAPDMELAGIFIDRNSWIIFGLVLLFMLSPDIAKMLPSSDARPATFDFRLSFLSSPITLILLAGLAGYLLYG